MNASDSIKQSSEGVGGVGGPGINGVLLHVSVMEPSHDLLEVALKRDCNAFKIKQDAPYDVFGSRPGVQLSSLPLPLAPQGQD